MLDQTERAKKKESIFFYFFFHWNGLRQKKIEPGHFESVERISLVEGNNERKKKVRWSKDFILFCFFLRSSSIWIFISSAFPRKQILYSIWISLDKQMSPIEGTHVWSYFWSLNKLLTYLSGWSPDRRRRKGTQKRRKMRKEGISQTRAGATSLDEYFFCYRY